jgi:hypothetical protein
LIAAGFRPVDWLIAPVETISALNSARCKALSGLVLLEKLMQLGTLPFPDNELTPEAHAR